MYSFVSLIDIMFNGMKQKGGKEEKQQKWKTAKKKMKNHFNRKICMSLVTIMILWQRQKRLSQELATHETQFEWVILSETVINDVHNLNNVTNFL